MDDYNDSDNVHSELTTTDLGSCDSRFSAKAWAMGRRSYLRRTKVCGERKGQNQTCQHKITAC